MSIKNLIKNFVSLSVLAITLATSVTAPVAQAQSTPPQGEMCLGVGRWEGRTVFTSSNSWKEDDYTGITPWLTSGKCLGYDGAYLTNNCNPSTGGLTGGPGEYKVSASTVNNLISKLCSAPAVNFMRNQGQTVYCFIGQADWMFPAQREQATAKFYTDAGYEGFNQNTKGSRHEFYGCTFETTIGSNNWVNWFNDASNVSGSSVTNPAEFKTIPIN